MEEISVTQALAWNSLVAQRIIDEKKALPGAMLPILHELQETFGYIDKEAETLIAETMNVSRAEVHGVVTFYPDFRLQAPAAHSLKLCRAEACQSRGGDDLAARATAALGLDFGETTADGRVHLQAVYCLGLCSVAPSAMLDGKIVGCLDEKKLDTLLAQVER
jgi:formate dehydrogenase subunit gamma